MGIVVQTLQILVSVLLIMVILLQVRESGSGLFGAGQSNFRTRRGLERTLFQATIVLAVTFLVLSIISVRTA